MLLCAGDEDRSTQSLRRRALVLAFRAQSDVTVDLKDLSFADTSLMIDLAMLSNRLRRRGRLLLLDGAQPQIMNLIETVGLHPPPRCAGSGHQPCSRSCLSRLHGATD